MEPIALQQRLDGPRTDPDNVATKLHLIMIKSPISQSLLLLRRLTPWLLLLPLMTPLAAAAGAATPAPLPSAEEAIEPPPAPLLTSPTDSPGPDPGKQPSSEKTAKEKPPQPTESRVSGNNVDSPFSTRVRGSKLQGERSISDFNLVVGGLKVVPRQSAAELLTLAPGILLTNSGGSGHAQRVFLRGFDAREGQDLEFTVGGVPINEVATAHGQGYADTHFILPELVESLRVIEGPFDPHQGDFAVAGSAEYQLGVSDRGLRLSYRGGSWNSHRLLLLWAPDSALGYGLGNSGTFAAVELAQSDGFGPNRFSQRATATAQYEHSVGETGKFRVLAMTYATRFQSPGVLRDDDYQSGRKEFFDTYDTRQGGDAQRHTFSAQLHGKVGVVQLSQQVFATVRDLRIRENFTGYQQDPQLLGQKNRGSNPQRGDLLDQHTSELTIGARSSLRLETNVLGQLQRLEAGFYARHDSTEASQLRLRAPEIGGSQVTPYRTDFDFATAATNLAGFLDAELHLTRFVTLRGGVRGDFFLFDVNNRCASMNVVQPGAELDQECYSIDRYGYRNPSERHTATGIAVQPRVTLQVQPFRGLSFSGSYGHGARSADPLFLADGEDAPFASIRAAEGGALFGRTLGAVEVTLRGAAFYTHVSGDLIFNQTVGRNTLSGGTTRVGALAAARATSSFLDAAVHVTWARATFDEDGLLVPYVPDLVVRSDLAAFGKVPGIQLLGKSFTASVGLGFTYVAPRPLPLSERGDPYALLDLSARVRWHAIELGLEIENLLNRRYRQSEFNYVSDFRSRAYPTLVASRHFIAGAPLGIFATVTLYLDQALQGLSRVKKEPAASAPDLRSGT